MPLFLVLTSALAVGSLERGGRRRYLVRRARRVAVPWTAWSAFYMALYILVDVGIHHQPLTSLIPSSPLPFLIGSTIHLWFLPFVMLMSFPIAVVVPLVEDTASLSYLAGFLVPHSVAGLYLHTRAAPPDPIGQWAIAFPSIGYGVVAALSHRYGTILVPITFIGVAATAGMLAGSEFKDVAQFIVAALIFEMLC